MSPTATKCWGGRQETEEQRGSPHCCCLPLTENVTQTPVGVSATYAWSPPWPGAAAADRPGGWCRWELPPWLDDAPRHRIRNQPGVKVSWDQFASLEQIQSVITSQRRPAVSSSCRCTSPRRWLLWSAGGPAGAQRLSKDSFTDWSRWERSRVRGKRVRAGRVSTSRGLNFGRECWSPPTQRRSL